MRNTSFFLLLLVLFGLAAHDVLAQTSATVSPMGRATYSQSLSGSDTLTVTGNIKITGERSIPSVGSEGVISGNSVTWVGRQQGKGVYFEVYGYYLGEDDGEKRTWTAYYDPDGYPVVVDMVINGTRTLDDDYVAYGDNGGSLTVYIRGGEPDTSYNVGLSTSPQGSPGGNVSLPGSVSMNSPGNKTEPLGGIAVGDVK